MYILQLTVDRGNLAASTEQRACLELWPEWPCRDSKIPRHRLSCIRDERIDPRSVVEKLILSILASSKVILRII